MLRSFFTITLRILWRNKVTTFVNIFSLSVGITAFIIIMLYVHHETAYNKDYPNYEHIYRLEGDNFAELPPIMGTLVKDRVPEVKNIARLAHIGKTTIIYSPVNDPENIKEIEVNSAWADSTTTDVFSLSFIKGDPHTALKDPFTAVITENSAAKLFDDENPMLQNIKIWDVNYQVTGIIKNVKNSQIEIDALYSMESIPKLFPDRDLNNGARNSWLWSATYLLVNKNIDETSVESKIYRALADINNGLTIDIKFNHFNIRPLTDIYFNGALQNRDYGLHGNLNLIFVLFVVGIIMLLLASINYVNLTTARSTIRAKEIAVKLVTGSSKILIKGQIIFETVLISFISLAVALAFLQIFLSKFNQMVMVNIPLMELNRPIVWIMIFVGSLLLGILSGLYPALYLTSVKPVILARGEGEKGTGRSVFRRALMTFQFVVSIVMIIGIIVNLRQLHYVRDADLGFNKDQIITFRTPSPEGDKQYSMRETLRDRLKQYPDIQNVAFSAGEPGGIIPTATSEIEGINRNTPFMFIDADYLDVMGIKVISGSGFLEDQLGEKAQIKTHERNVNDNVQINTLPVLLNETAVGQFGLGSPLGKIIHWKDGVNDRLFEVIGIVKDFHYRSLHEKIEPMVLMRARPQNLANVKISSTNIPGTLKNIKKEFENVYDQVKFSYSFLNETFDRQYKSDEQLAIVIRYFTVLAVIIACLGLFSLSSFMVSRRTKEIGIRKTLGASILTIYIMLSWDFLKWILLAIVIASPIAWYLTNIWLQSFAYRITIGPDIFILSALISIIIALSTITWQSLKTARANPVEALRYE